MRWPRSLSLGLALAALGCQTFQPVELSDLTPGMEIRARVSSAEAAQLIEALPTETDRLIAGTVVAAGPSELLLAVPVTVRNVPGQRETLRQRIAIPADEVFEVEMKSLDRTKTGVLSAATALIVGYVLYRSLREGSSGRTPHDGGPGPQDAVISARIPLGR